MDRLTSLDWVTLVLVIIGGLNWGLVGAFKFDLVAEIFGTYSFMSRLIYILVGLSALYLAIAMTRFGRVSNRTNL